MQPAHDQYIAALQRFIHARCLRSAVHHEPLLLMTAGTTDPLFGGNHVQRLFGHFHLIDVDLNPSGNFRRIGLQTALPLPSRPWQIHLPEPTSALSPGVNMQSSSRNIPHRQRSDMIRI
jgi:hypothetical protein